MNNSYLEIRKNIDNLIDKLPNCCSRGCSYCCNQMIELLNIEIETFRQTFLENITDQTKEKIKQNLNDWFAFFDSKTPDNKTLSIQDIFVTFKNYSISEKQKCPLLIDNKCSVYSNRPLACRMHLVENSPQNCASAPFRNPMDDVMFIRQRLITSLQSVMEVSIKPLPYVIADILIPERKLKPIEDLVLK